MLKLEVIGNLGSDAEIKDDNGRKYVQFSVADTRRFTKADGTKSEATNWVSCFMRNPDAEVIKYLKKGTKVFVRGNGELRIFSSAKDRMMKAGVSINVQEVELVGGSSDEIPRELAVPETGMLIQVSKYYWADVSKLDARPTFLYDRAGRMYSVDSNGFITAPQQPAAEAQHEEQQEQQLQQDVQTVVNDDAPFTGNDTPLQQNMANANGKRKK